MAGRRGRVQANRKKDGRPVCECMRECVRVAQTCLCTFDPCLWWSHVWEGQKSKLFRDEIQRLGILWRWSVRYSFRVDDVFRLDVGKKRSTIVNCSFRKLNTREHNLFYYNYQRSQIINFIRHTVRITFRIKPTLSIFFSFAINVNKIALHYIEQFWIYLCIFSPCIHAFTVYS